MPMMRCLPTSKTPTSRSKGDRLLPVNASQSHRPVMHLPVDVRAASSAFSSDLAGLIHRRNRGIFNPIN